MECDAYYLVCCDLLNYAIQNKTVAMLPSKVSLPETFMIDKAGLYRISFPDDSIRPAVSAGSGM